MVLGARGEVLIASLVVHHAKLAASFQLPCLSGITKKDFQTFLRAQLSA